MEAAEVLGVLCRDDEHASWIVNALTDELAAPTAETAVRLRLTQALIELPVDAAGEVLRRLVRDSAPPSPASPRSSPESRTRGAAEDTAMASGRASSLFIFTWRVVDGASQIPTIVE